MFKKVIISLFLIAAFVGAYIAYDMYQQVYQPNVTLENSTDKYFYVSSDSQFDDIVHNLYEKGYIINRENYVLRNLMSLTVFCIIYFITNKLNIRSK